MSKVKVLTEAEIENIKKVREDFQILVGNVGEVEVAIMNLNKKKKELENELLLIQEKETKIAVDIEKKNEKGNISLITGEFTIIE